MLRVLALNKPEWWIIIIGCISSILSGAVQPSFSIVFSKVIAVSIVDITIIIELNILFKGVSKM
jgi:hypothetical protein